jgi:hypothetical protein
LKSYAPQIVNYPWIPKRRLAEDAPHLVHEEIGSFERVHHFAGPCSAPTEKVRLPERHTQMAKEVVGSRHVEEEVRNRETQ